MFCPFKMANPELASHYDSRTETYTDWNWDCEKGSCELWNERFGQCSFHVLTVMPEAAAVDAYLKGQAEKKEITP